MIEMKVAAKCVLCRKFHKCKKQKWNEDCFEAGRSKQKYPCNKCKSEYKENGSCALACKMWWAWVLGEYGWDATVEKLKERAKNDES